MQQEWARFTRGSYEILGLSFLGLFLELAIIRWLSSEIRIFAYFKNLPLLAAFLGFGTGFWLYDKCDRFFPWFPRLICYLVIIIAGAAGFGTTHVIFVDPKQYFLLGVGFGDHASQSILLMLHTTKALSVIVVVFFLVMAVFASVAPKLGQLLNQGKPLRPYSLNVAGSLLGIIAFCLVSFLHSPPAVWLFLFFSGMLYFFTDRLKSTLVYFIAALIFAKAFEEAKIPSLALGSNLLGALVGGILEYLDMWVGLRWLNIIALILYLLSFVFLSRKIGTRVPRHVGRFSVEVS